MDGQIKRLLEAADPKLVETLRPLGTLGLHHEQKHQELIHTDIKHLFSTNPLLPTYRPRRIVAHALPRPRGVGAV